ncbi:MAG: hypothetical protein GX596_01205 [Propionibacterium sp.]|nr:hypothetical protein [Propionibacterium sp.]
MDVRPVDEHGRHIETRKSLIAEGWVRYALWIVGALLVFLLSFLYLSRPLAVLGETALHYLPAIAAFLLLGLPWKSPYVPRKLRDDVVAPWFIMLIIALFTTAFTAAEEAAYGQTVAAIYLGFGIYMWIGLTRAALAMLFDRRNGVVAPDPEDDVPA